MTVKEFLKTLDIVKVSLNGSIFYTKEFLEKAMIEFAKYHVQEALDAQAKLAKRCIINNSPVPSKDFLRKSYPLKNINNE